MKTLNRKHRKFKLSLQIAAILSCVAIASVGFAGWIIVGDNAVNSASGSITAFTVSDSNLTFEEIETTNNIIFGKKDIASGKTNYGWLQADGVSDEVMSVTIPVKYSCAEVPSNAKANITVEFDGVVGQEVDNARLVDLINNQYIKLSLTANGVSSEYYVKSDDDKKEFTTDGATVEFTLDATTLQAATSETKGSFDIEITFDWGTKTSYKNPYVYYNSLKKSEGWVTEAKGVLSTIYNAVNGKGTYAGDTPLTYQVVVSAKLTFDTTTTN